MTNNGSWVTIYTSTGIGDVSTGISGKANGTYPYRVKACNGSGFSAYSATKTTVVLHIPGVLALYAPSRVSDYSEFSVSWSSVSTASRYELQRYHTDSWMPGYKTWTTIYNSTGLSISVGVGKSTFHSFRIRACNRSGCSAYSFVKSVKVYRS